MIRFQCQCGMGQSVHASEAEQAFHCPSCGAPLRLVFGRPAPAGAECSARLVVRGGPILAGTEFILGGTSPIEVGSRSTNHLLLPGTFVAPNQCRLVPDSWGWTLVDDASDNGTFVNCDRVTLHDLADGDVITLGEHEFEFHCAAVATLRAARPAIPAAETPFAAFDAYDEPIHLGSAVGQDLDRNAHTGATGPAAVSDGTTPKHDYRFDPSNCGDLEAGVVLRVTSGPAADGDISAEEQPRSPGLPPASLAPPPHCPACNRALAPGAKVCVQCGVDLRTGHSIITARGQDEDQLHTDAEALVGILSWLLPFGLYPIAFEAYGAFKPYAIRGIALLTIITTVAFWLSHNDLTGPGRQLQLWAGSLSPTVITDVYTSPDAIDESQQQAYQQKVNELRRSVPQAELPLAAYRALPADRQVFGHFAPYQLVTSIFLHGAILHLAWNLLCLFLFGSRVNALIGQWKTVAIYLLLAVVSGLMYCAAQANRSPAPWVGASGAVMGMVGVYLVLFPIHRIHSVVWFRPTPLWFPFLYLRHSITTTDDSDSLHASMNLFAPRGFWMVLLYITSDMLYTTFISEDVAAHWAHLGGLVGGMVVGVVLLLTRAIDARGGDLISVVLGKHAWALIGKPQDRRGVRPRASVQPA